MTTLAWINEWHTRACHAPDQRAFDVQLGCHLEEIVEMLDELDVDGASVYQHNAKTALHDLATMLKKGHAFARINNREKFLDSLADQVVTAVGSGYRAGMNMVQACSRVDRSNWSKFDENGHPIFDENGKIKKGPNYVEPDLSGLF